MTLAPTEHDLAILRRLLVEGFPALTANQSAALEAIARHDVNAVKWREELADQWFGCREPEAHKPALRQVRNTFGPTWLFDVYAWGWRPDLPTWERPSRKPDGSGFIEALPGLARWSADFDPPPVGTMVYCRMNNLGPATVTGYFVEGGWLGLVVKLHNPPEFYTCQNGGNPPGHCFGAEVEMIAATHRGAA